MPSINGRRNNGKKPVLRLLRGTTPIISETRLNEARFGSNIVVVRMPDSTTRYVPVAAFTRFQKMARTKKISVGTYLYRLYRKAGFDK